jgi:hypothetical protein
MVGDTDDECIMGAGTSFERALRMFHDATSFFVNCVAMKRAGRSGMAAFCLALLLHAGTVVLMVTTEVSLVGMAVFLLVWIMLNCLWLTLLRRPTAAALISLEILVALSLLSRFKFDKLWMTIDFVDVMIVDRDTTAFLLATFPPLRWWFLLAAAVTTVAIVIAWRLDRYRVSLQRSLDSRYRLWHSLLCRCFGRLGSTRISKAKATSQNLRGRG